MPARLVSSPPWTFLAAACALALVGCGAKTGLYVPDGGDNESFDAGVDGGLDASMADAGPDADICVDVPFDGGPVEVDLDVEAQVGAADIAFLIDVTASMQEEIEEIRSRLRDQLVPAIRDAVPDSRLAVATFADFPVGDYGSSGAGDKPFELRLPMTSNINEVQAAVDNIELGDGRDIQESQVEALYQLATGAGRGSYVEPSAGCPAGGLGYACVRRDALPVVLLFTDAEFHNGPGGVFPYGSDVIPRPATYEEAVRALNALGVRVMGFDSGGGLARDHLREVARDTEAIAEGSPLVFDIGTSGQRLGTSVVEAIETLAGSLEQDIDAVLVDPVPSDGVNVLDFVEGVVPLRAEPPDGVAGIDVEGGVFLQARAGTRLIWQIVVRNDAVVPGPSPRRFRLEIIFRGDARRRLGRRFIDIVVPGEGGEGCDELFP
ncbi:MAG TPA: vWA domain-containing protein [Polyangiaceae bacterium LLY-WYZ-15_(1-7)]|nr:hypothetical protein [Myxococcales bacterium]MAT24014.1 hypothetical protein [Sandaracinus sp.]HJK93957.1 vWA domain-containing protein [Polyangiaceae bacterium LLY-WYZ-15_(1-7)]MBJ70283.1 hypothetical protein [Sandaracinus sp.]HJL01264.1 vWA domain-containing protein [Polyangiaceae bacterium LLY-WYZ-15_(1-7)]